MSDLFLATLDSPLGRVLLFSTRHALVEVRLPAKGSAEPQGTGVGESPAVLARAVDELDQYFRGRRTAFSTPSYAAGTDFQRAVWSALEEIPFGQVLSYGGLAARIGRPGASRAVGSANGRNLLPIFFPCHRVIRADGSLSGYGGGVPAKRWLLSHERRVLGLPPLP